ncbi:COG1361 S-layer family protein [Pyrococcus kukulkanii]|uniref:COG1361 S-layer family protein n=1 Tax=Pyrococcus kukulkanii TaxID=1609559 RepID=UPI003567CCF9
MKGSKLIAILTIIAMLITPSWAQGPELLFEGYVNKGDYLLVGPLTIIVKDVVYDINDGKWKVLFIILDEDMNPIGPNLTKIYVPDPEKVQQLLVNQTFLRAMAETLGYNPDSPVEYAEFLRWLSSASQMEVWNAIVKTIEEHPELGISLNDIAKPILVPNARPVGVNETVKIEYHGETLYITPLFVYPNGAKISISGPIRWRVSMVQGLLLSKIEVKGTVRPGEVFYVNVHLKNIGSRRVRFVTVILSPTPVIPEVTSKEESAASILPQTLAQTGVAQSSLYPLGTTMKFIDYIEPGEDKVITFSYKANENARPGDYPLYLTVVYFSYTTGENLEQRVLYDSTAITIAKDYEATFIVENQSIPRVVHPGEDFTVKVVLKNSGSDTAKNVVGTLVLEDIKGRPFAPVSSNSFYTRFVESGETIVKEFKLHVDESAKTGTYIFKLRVTYYSGNTNNKVTQEFTFSTTVIRHRAAFIEIENVTIEPKKVEPGMTFRVTLTLKNMGEGYAKGLKIKIIPVEVLVRREIQKIDISQLSSLPIPQSQQISENLQSAINQLIGEIAVEKMPAFLPVGEDNVKYDGIILPNQTIKLSFILKANGRLENNIYPLKVSLTYLSSPDDTEFSDERIIGIDVTGVEMIVISRVSTSPSRVLPGNSDVEVSFTVENIGSGEARYVLLKPIPSYPFKLSETSDQIINVGTLKQGDSARASFKVDVDKDAKSGTYQIPVIVTYKDPTGEFKELKLSIPIIIEEKPNIVVEKVEFNPEPVQGKDVNIYVTVKNIGGEKAESVVIEGVVRSSQPFTLVKRTDYVGTLAPNQTGQGVITLTVDKDAIPKVYNILIRIRAVGDRDKGDDNVYIFEHTIKIPVKENVEEKERLKKLAIGAGVLAVLVTLLIYLKRKKSSS